jgi:hypothetical protein
MQAVGYHFVIQNAITICCSAKGYCIKLDGIAIFTLNFDNQLSKFQEQDDPTITRETD